MSITGTFGELFTQSTDPITPRRLISRFESGKIRSVRRVWSMSMHGVKVKPAKCADAAVTGFNSPAFAHAPASVVTFRVGHDGVSEVPIRPGR